MHDRAAHSFVMVGLGPTIHEYPSVADKLVDGPPTNVGLRRRPKHDHEGETARTTMAVGGAKLRSAQR
jgi:hypothetical protein